MFVRTLGIIAGLLLALLAPQGAWAQNCGSPVNVITNPTFDSGLTGHTNGGSWAFNQTLSTAIYGTTYTSRASVQNPGAAPSGADAAAYPAATTSAFVIDENDGANDTLTPGRVSGSHITYFANALHIWFDMGWRQAGGTGNFAATLQVKVNGTTYMTITTVAGNSPGNATGVVANGASLGTGTPTTYANTGGAGALSQWNTIHLVVPYTSATAPTVSFAMSGGAGISDDFALDRIYVPMCQVSALAIAKTSTVISDPVNGTSSPRMMPGARVRYCIQAANPSGNPTASSVTMLDLISGLPVTYVAGSLRVNGTVTGGQCNWDGVAGGTYSAGTVSATLSPIAQGAKATMYFDVTID